MYLRAVVHYAVLAVVWSALTYGGVLAYGKFGPAVSPVLESLPEKAAAITTKPVAPRATPRPRVTPTPTPAPSQPRPAPAGHWGVVKAEQGKVYSTKGKLISRLPLGTPVSISRIVLGKSGELAVCKTVGHSDMPDTFVMKTADLLLRAGTYATASSREKELVQQRVELEGSLARRQRQTADTAMRRNPYYGDYQRVQADYKAFWDKVKKLQARRDNTTGAKHMEHADQLRMLKGQDIELARELKALKNKFDDWNESHPAAPVDDPQVAALTARIGELNGQLAEMDTNP